MAKIVKVWPEAVFRSVVCRIHGTHNIRTDDNSWCRSCDTGECEGCGSPLMWHEACGWYHHIFDVEPCFMNKTDCEVTG